MAEALASAIATPGLWWLVLAVVAAGLVRGFSGFGSAMIIMPAASSVLSPVEAVVFVAAAELLGPLPNLPDAWRSGERREVGLLLLGAVLALPLGLWWLTSVDPDLFGWTVSGIVILLLALLMTGWRYRGRLTRPMVVGTGGVGGVMTGIAGVPGPPVIMLYMASTLPIATIRANFLLYLLGIDIVLCLLLWGMGLLVWKIVVLGLLIGLVNVAANAAGARFFDPTQEGRYRIVAYIVIAASALLGLPVWG